jgi:hypothetical protein
MGFMKITRGVALALGLALAMLAGPSATAAPERDNFSFLQDSTVRVIAYHPRGGVTLGTGFVIVAADDSRNAGNAIIVTAAHVVRRAQRVRVVEANSGQQLEANVRATDDDRDIAFLEVRRMRNGGIPLTVTSMAPSVGQDLRTAGYSEAADAGVSRNEPDDPETGQPLAAIAGVQSGSYSRTIPNPRPIWRFADVGVNQFQHSIPLSSTFSGGPVIDKCGRVVGFNVSNPTSGPSVGMLNIEPGVSFAVASTEIIKAAEDNGIRLTPDPSSCTSGVAGRTPSPTPNDNSSNVAPNPEPEKQGFPGRTELAIIIGAFALLALGLAAWLVLGRGGARSRRRAAAPPPAAPPPPSAAPSAARSESRPPSAAKPGPTSEIPLSRALTMRGSGPGGEPISHRLAADELQAHARTLGTDAEVRIPDGRAKAFVSRHHAELSWDGQHFYIKDLKSMNGTVVDGQELKPLEKRRLHDGAIVKLADVVLSIHID